MDYPTQSPDLNIKDLLKDHLDREHKPKAANVQGRALKCPSRNLENYTWSYYKL